MSVAVVCYMSLNLVARADAAMYQAKRDGRDRVSIAANGEPVPPPRRSEPAATPEQGLVGDREQGLVGDRSSA